MQIALPWNDRQGRFAPLKALALAGVIAPGLWIGGHGLNGTLGAKPLEVALHETGLWAVRLLLVTLAITPLRLITGWGKLAQLRRMLGVAALAYTLVHLFLYVVQQRYDLVVVVLEIIRRFYLTIGFLALGAMVALGVTSTDGTIRRMGAESWNRLHRLIYPLTALAIFHAFLQAKINVSEEVVQIGVFLVLMAVRVLDKRRWLNAWALLALALLAVPLTAALEALWYGLATGVPWRRILDANLMLALAPRPALVVGMIALSLPLLALLRPRPSAAGTRRATV
ncbi:MAG: sulfoxide reductase heme-binding subunit YedZ [Methylobacterium sp.]|jgi:sulfoxide reductase heme-binding subunit YedZ|nr:sulfoxide reductase heme-binding subunit YedZ [Methylobacterium sp.]